MTINDVIAYSAKIMRNATVGRVEADSPKDAERFSEIEEQAQQQLFATIAERKADYPD